MNQNQNPETNGPKMIMKKLERKAFVSTWQRCNIIPIQEGEESALKRGV